MFLGYSPLLTSNLACFWDFPTFDVKSGMFLGFSLIRHQFWHALTGFLHVLTGFLHVLTGFPMFLGISGTCSSGFVYFEAGFEGDVPESDDS